MWNDLRHNLKNVKEKIAGIDKKTAREEYISLVQQKAAFEAELNKKKSEYYAELAKLPNKEKRKLSDHVKFLLGGIAIKYLRDLPAEKIAKINLESPDQLEKMLIERITAKTKVNYEDRTLA